MKVSQAILEVYKAGYRDGMKRSGEEVMSVGEFLSGLSHLDTLAVANDIFLYGNAFVETIEGRKLRIPPKRWEEIVIKHEARPISDGAPGMSVQ